MYKAPIKPFLRSAEDVSHFAEDFTVQPPEDKPAEKPHHRNAANFFRGNFSLCLYFPEYYYNYYLFHHVINIGYSFVSPELMKSKEYITNNPKESLERPILEDIFKFQRLVRDFFFKSRATSIYGIYFLLVY